MSNSTWKKLAGAGRLLLAYLLVLSQSVWAGQDLKAKDSPKPAQKATTQQAIEKPPSAAAASKAPIEEAQEKDFEQPTAKGKASGGGKQEGIKVHGHWTIEVRNPDGTLVTRREVENTLVTDGAIALTGLLSRGASAGFWLVDADGGLSPGPCPLAGTPSTVCVIAEAGLGNPATSGVFPTLTVAPGPGSNSVVLSGTAKAGAYGIINRVQSSLYLCSNTVAPNTSCDINHGFSFGVQTSNTFTAVTLTGSQVVQVVAGQTVAFTVVISFS